MLEIRGIRIRRNPAITIEIVVMIERGEVDIDGGLNSSSGIRQRWRCRRELVDGDIDGLKNEKRDRSRDAGGNVNVPIFSELHN